MKFWAVFSTLLAVCAAHPGIWIRSSVNTQKSCVVPVGFPASFMNTQRVADAKNGAPCNVVFKGNTITVRSNMRYGTLGYIAAVTEGTVAKPNGLYAGNQGNTCAWGQAGATITFTYTPPAKPTGKPIRASVTCGSYSDPTMYTTLGVNRTP